MGNQSTTMKKLICILASAALFGACEQKTETVAPAAPAEKKTENNTTIVNPSTNTEKTKETKEIKTTAPVMSSSETKVDTTTTTTASPNP